MHQSNDGAFKPSKAFYTQCHVSDITQFSVETLVSHHFAGPKTEALAATLVALATFQTKYPELEAKWRKMAEKARKWCLEVEKQKTDELLDGIRAILRESL